jgi:hypothetical protein
MEGGLLFFYFFLEKKQGYRGQGFIFNTSNDVDGYLLFKFFK